MRVTGQQQPSRDIIYDPILDPQHHTTHALSAYPHHLPLQHITDQ